MARRALRADGLTVHPEKRVGRPSAADLQQRQIAEVFERHANGEPLREVCAAVGLKPAAFRSLVRKNPVLQREWEDVRKDYVHSMFDELASITRELAEVRFGKEDNARVQALRAAQDGLKHMTARLNPQQYGEQQKGSGQALTVVINTTLPIGDGDKAPVVLDGDFKLAVPLLEKPHD